MRRSHLIIAVLVLVALGTFVLVRGSSSERRIDDALTSGEPLVAVPWDRRTKRAVGRGVRVVVPDDWSRDVGPELTPIVFSSDAEKAWAERLGTDCAYPVVLRWRDQWRGECLTPRGLRIRGAVIRTGGEWRGVEARYPDAQDATLAPRVARMLASLRPSR